MDHRGWYAILLNINGEPSAGVVNLQIIRAVNEDKKEKNPKIKDNWREPHEMNLLRSIQRDVRRDIQ